VEYCEEVKQKKKEKKKGQAIQVNNKEQPLAEDGSGTG
jgi:hypothetical protein